MFLSVPEFLTPPEVQALRDVAAQGTFVDGKASAGSAGEDIKRNEELKFTPDQVALVNKVLQSAIQRSKDVQFFAWPRRVQTPFISRYGAGMGYGGHFDNPIMFSRDGEPIRTECAYKYRLSQLGELADRFEVHRVWLDDRKRFSLQYMVVRDDGSADGRTLAGTGTAPKVL